jgi:hypothetical protein
MSESIYQAIASVMQEVEAIGKNQKNQQQGFRFRGIDDVYNAIHPVFAKHGVFSTTNVVAERTEERQTSRGGNLIYRILTIEYTFYASDGSSVKETIIGEGMDSGDKAANKAMAIAHKYALLQLLCIPTEDMVDPDSEAQEPSVPAVRPERKEARSAPKDGWPSPIPEDQFTIPAAWNSILQLCGGDSDFAMRLFRSCGAKASDDINYGVYRAAFDCAVSTRKKAEA